MAMISLLVCSRISGNRNWSLLNLLKSLKGMSSNYENTDPAPLWSRKLLDICGGFGHVSFTDAWILMLEYFLFHRCGVSRTIFLEQPIVRRRVKAEIDDKIGLRWRAERANNSAFMRSDFYKTLVEQQALNIYYNIKMSELSVLPPPLVQKESDIILAQDSIRRQEPPVLPRILLKIRILSLFPPFMRRALFKLYRALRYRLNPIPYLRKMKRSFVKRLFHT